MDFVNLSNFLNRVSALQRLCSFSDSNLPSALLFIPGQDGRNNSGSINLVKYLAKGSTGKDLLDDTLDQKNEILEDLVILINSTSVAVIWTHEMRKLLIPYFEHIPILVEYLSSPEEESEIDLLQSRKCVDFKRMILEFVKEGNGIGIPVPIGYDEVIDIESWPLLQSFALDHVYCPTGFFTMRYVVADVTTHLENIYRVVDGYCVDNALQALRRTVAPHHIQAVSMLDASTADQRMRVTADDVVGPLDVLFEFGEMECGGKLDATTRPVVFFGVDSAQLVGGGAYPAGWREQRAGHAQHVVMEGSEPSTGMRWARTYFLNRGQAVAAVDLEESATSGPARAAITIPRDITEPLCRLERLYMKLVLSLRFAVRSAFTNHHDVLEAGSEIQHTLEGAMKGSIDLLQYSPQFAALQLHRDTSLHLRSHEQLQVHMDCCNALGEIVTIDDVDDLGGSCWTYIRVAVHGIDIPAYGVQFPATVVVGDTFLFSSHRSVLHKNASGANPSVKSENKDKALLLSDGCCMTHLLPYYRALFGGGAEEASAQRLLSATHSPHIVPSLGLGKMLDLTGTGLLNTIPCLTDHPFLPHFEADLRLFAEGVVIEKVNCISSLPLLLSIERHVDRVWSADLADCWVQARKLRHGSTAIESSLVGDVDIPAGTLFLFRVKEGLEHNPLLPFYPYAASDSSASRLLAIVLLSNARESGPLSTAIGYWRNALRLHEVSEHRGSADVAIPPAILLAFAAWLDHLQEGSPNVYTATDLNKGSTEEVVSQLSSISDVVKLVETVISRSVVDIPALGSSVCRSVHAVSEGQRLSNFPYTTIQEPSGDSTLRRDALFVVLSTNGTGNQTISLNLCNQIVSAANKDSANAAFSEVIHVCVDLSQLQVGEDVGSYIARATQHSMPCRQSQRGYIARVVSVVLSSAHLPPISSVLESIALHFQSEVYACVSVATTDNETLKKRTTAETAAGGLGLGYEVFFAASVRAILEPTVCDVALIIDETAASTGATPGGSSEGGYRALLKHMQICNPAAHLVRLSPFGLRLDEDDLAVLLNTARGVSPHRIARIARGRPTFAALKEAQSRAKDALNTFLAQSTPFHTQSPSSVPASLVTVRFTAADLGGEKLGWKFPLLQRVCQLIFPLAKFSNADVADKSWVVPPRRKGDNAFQRMLHLGLAKVVAQRQEEESRLRFEHQVALLTQGAGTEGSSAYHLSGAAVLHRLVRGIRSISASVGVTIEGNRRFVLSRNQDTSSASLWRTKGDQTVMVVEGILGKAEIALLQDLFTASAQFQLSAQKRMTPRDVGEVTKLKIQLQDSKYAQAVPLPNNWWYDGGAYVNISGTRKILRPDIEDLVALYVSDENTRIDKYNSLIASV